MRLGAIHAAAALCVIAAISLFSMQTHAGSPQTNGRQQAPVKVRLTVGNKSATATLIDSQTARGFVSLLPLTVNMDDLFRREKFGPLPKAISTDGKHSFTYEVGQIGYWSPGQEVAIYYKQDSSRILGPGIIVIGKIEGDGSKLFDVSGSVKVTIRKAEDGN